MLNIGILGTGAIAKTMAQTIAYIAKTDGTMKLYAVASRELSKAEEFSRQYGAEKAFGSYGELCADPQVELVYIATPHGRHFEDAMLALGENKHVLCEKAFTLNAGFAQRMEDEAEKRGLFLCEAMWARFFPCARQAVKWLAEDRIGEIRCVRANFGFNAGDNFESRLLKLPLGGGALLDAGIYPLSFVSWAYGDRAPEHVRAFSKFFDNGADSLTSIMLDYGEGTAQVTCSLNTRLPSEGRIFGERGQIMLDGTLIAPGRATLRVEGREDEVFESQNEFNGYEYELRSVYKAISEGRRDCPEITRENTLTIMHTIDRVKLHTGLAYPQEL